MGTELHHALNLHETLQTNKCSALRYNIGAPHCRPCSRKLIDIEEQASISWCQPPGFMERFEEKFDHGAMRQAMLKQDEIFREQVGELHRLYQVQKKLMAELRNNEMRSLAPISQYPIPNTAQMGNTHANQAHEHIFWSTSMRQSSHLTFVSPPSDRGLEQPSSPSHRGIFYLEQQTINADNSLRNAMVENEHELVLEQREKEVDTNLELTLGVGQASNSRKDKEKRPTNSSDGEGDSSDMNNPSSSQENSKKPHWLLRALNLNRT